MNPHIKKIFNPDPQVKTFGDRIIKHHKMVQSYNELGITLSNPKGASIIHLVGATGAGKSTLIKLLKADMLECAMPTMLKNKTAIPFISADAKSPEKGFFDWKDLYKRLISSANEPLPEKKSIPHGFLRESLTNGANVKKEATTDEYRRILENIARQRKVKLIIIDEAQHLQKVKSFKTVSHQLDSLKGLADASNAKILLVGTYNMLSMLYLNGQLCRRSAIIHLPRYFWSVREDNKHFHEILLTFQSHLTTIKKSRLLPHVDFMYEKSAGCVGILKEWLEEAYNYVMANELDSITHAILQKTAHNPQKLKQIINEVLEGERIYYSNDDTNIRELLEIDTHQQPATKPRGNRKPGQRNPTRDIVGGDNP